MSAGLPAIVGLAAGAFAGTNVDNAVVTVASVTAATVITLGAGGDNLAVYIPLFRVARFGGTAVSLLVFAVGEALFTLLVLRAGRHRRVRAAVTAFGVVAAPILYCAIGVLVLVESGTFSLFG
jgi:cadmium resistance protein CadD (predicted permease)